MTSNSNTPVHEMSSIGLADEAKQWEIVIQQARKSIGEFNMSHFQGVDLEEPSATKGGTGFYVQEEKGFVLTNKHLVSRGPCFGFIVFEGNIEVRSWPRSHPFWL